MKLTLNVGCGGRTYSEYPAKHKCINYDERKLEKVDVLGDVRILPFSNETFDYILASDIIEHFPIAQTDNVLKEWCRVLKVRGEIEFRMPNLRKICGSYVANKIDTKMASWLLYGGQDYSGNFHYVGFDREWFRKIVRKHQLIEMGYKDVGNNFEMIVRKNG